MSFRIAVRLALALAAAGLSACSEQPSPPVKASAPAPAAAPTAKPAASPVTAAAPLGSKDNPVKCDMPAGERAYLERLRCPDGSTPTYRRAGSVGKGPSGNILDSYIVDCGGKETTILMDMYHAGHIEKQAVPGFTIVE